MIALESAVRSASKGEKVFLTCFNRLVGEWMQKQLADWDDKITVKHLHRYMFDTLKGFDFDNSREKKQDFFEKYLPVLLKDFFDKGIHDKFDKLIIDEGQDLIRDEYLQLFDSMLKDGFRNSKWEIYGDFEKQAIFSQMSKKICLICWNQKQTSPIFC